MENFDAVFALSDQHALATILALTNAGVNVPNDVMVFGFDNSIYSMISTPLISTVDRNAQQMALTACEKLLEIIDNEKELKEEQIIIPTQLIERGSTKIVRKVSDKDFQIK